MSTSQRARSGVPLDQRSALPSVPGIPAWGAVAVAVGAAVLGFLVDAMRVGELSSTFAVLYVLGSLIAVVVVRHRGLFTAMVQPPIVMFLGVPIAYQLTTDDAGTSIKDIVLTVAVPLVDRFPLMFLTTLLVLGIGGARLALDRRPAPVAKPSAKTPAKPTTRTQTPPKAKASDKRSRTATGRSDERRTARTAPRESEPRHERTRRDRPAPQPPREETNRAPRHAPRAYEGQVTATDYARTPRHETPRHENPRHENPTYEPRRTGAENMSPYPAPRVRYRDRD